jgi:hypothetical protein
MERAIRQLKMENQEESIIFHQKLLKQWITYQSMPFTTELTEYGMKNKYQMTGEKDFS